MHTWVSHFWKPNPRVQINLHIWNYNPLYECDASDRVVYQILPSELLKQAHGIRLKFEPSRDDDTTNIFK